MSRVHVLSHYSSTIENEIVTPALVSNALTGDTVATKGIWDTGATDSVITSALAMRLNLYPIGRNTVLGVHGTRDVNVYYVKITLNNDNIEVKCTVTESDALSSDGSIGLLIGMNVISMGDFSISNFDGKTTMTFRVPSIEKTDYVKEVRESNEMLKRHEAMAKHGNDKCPCGSGKLWMNCHGKCKYFNL